MKNFLPVAVTITLSFLASSAIAETREIYQQGGRSGPMYLTNDATVTQAVQTYLGSGRVVEYKYFGSNFYCRPNGNTKPCDFRLEYNQSVATAIATAVTVTAKFGEIVTASLATTLTRTETVGGSEAITTDIKKGGSIAAVRYIKRANVKGTFKGAWVRTGEKGFCNMYGDCEYWDVYTIDRNIVVADYTGVAQQGQVTNSSISWMGNGPRPGKYYLTPG